MKLLSMTWTVIGTITVLLLFLIWVNDDNIIIKKKRKIFVQQKRECSFYEMNISRTFQREYVSYPEPNETLITKILTYKPIKSDYNVLRNMVLSFVGDSTLHAQYYVMCHFLKGKFTTYEKFRIIDNITKTSTFEGECYIDWLNSTLMFRGVGRIHQWGTLRSPEVVLKDAFRELRRSDILVFNIGIHYQHYCRAFSKNQLQESDMNFYKRSVQSMLDVLNQELFVNNTHCGNAPCNTSTNNGYYQCCRRCDKPRIIWRESLPQHFNTSNGEFPNKAERASFRKHLVGDCTELTPEMYNGLGLPNECVPNCLPANWRNDLVKSLLTEACFEYFPVYSDMLPMKQMHAHQNGSPDCTHYTEQANHYLNGKLLEQIKVRVCQCESSY